MGSTLAELRDRQDGAALAPPPPRCARPGFVVYFAALLCLALVADCLTFSLVDGGTLKGIDFALLGAALVFLVIAIRSPARRQQWSLCVIVIAATTLATEQFLTQLAPSGFPWHVWPPNLHREMKPVGLAGVGPTARFTTNSLGIRGPEPSSGDKLRILCVGGSTTECIYLDDDKTWPKLLGDRLAATGPVWVGNAGRSGLMACEHRLYLEHAPEADLADIWIVLAGFNDLHQQLMGTYEDSKAHAWQRTFVHRRPGLRGTLRRPFHRNLFLVHGLDEAIHTVRRNIFGTGGGAFQDSQADWTRKKQRERAAATITDGLPDLTPYLAEYRGEIEALIDLSRQRGKRLVLLTQPTLYSDPMPAEFEALTMGGRLPDGRFLSTRQRLRAMERFNDVMRDLAARHGVLCVDLARRVPPSTDAFYDDCHFNEGGGRIVADLVAQRLLPEP